jgi:hypothetical protein
VEVLKGLLEQDVGKRVKFDAVVGFVCSSEAQQIVEGIQVE